MMESLLLILLTICCTCVWSSEKVETYDGYSTSEECAGLAIFKLEKSLRCNVSNCAVNGSSVGWGFNVSAPNHLLQWSVYINASGTSYMGNGSEDLENNVVYSNIRNIEIEADTGGLYIPFVSKALGGSVFNCTAFDFDNRICGQSEPLSLKVLVDEQLGNTFPLVTTFLGGPGTTMERISVSANEVVRVDIGSHNFFCVDGKTRSKDFLPMWTIGNTTVQAISLYQSNVSHSLLSAVNGCISCSCVGKLFDAKVLPSILEKSPTHGYVGASAFVVFGYTGSIDEIKHYRCSLLYNLFVSFIVVSGMGHNVLDLEFNITAFENRPTTRKYTVEFDFFQGSPTFHSQAKSLQVQEHSSTFFICNASTSVNATLSWKSDNVAIWQRNLSSVYQNREILSSKYIEMLCSNVTTKVFYINLYRKRIPRSEIDYTVVLNQLSVLLMCNAEQSLQGEYQCIASNSNASGLSLSVKVVPSKPLVIVVSSTTGTAVTVVILFIVMIIIIRGCLRARAISKEPIQMRPVHYGNLEFSEYSDCVSSEFPRHSLQLDKILGEGQFGQVWKAYADGICAYDRNRKVVAVKTLKRNATPADKDDLNAELETMKNMEPHPNIINFLGQCSETASDPLLILMEFAVFGSLKDYLKSLNAVTGNCVLQNFKPATAAMLEENSSCCHSQHNKSTTPGSVSADPATIAHASRLLRLLNVDAVACKLEDSESDCVLSTAGCVHRPCLDDYPCWIGSPTQNEYYNAYHSQSQVSPEAFAANSCDESASNSAHYVNTPQEERHGFVRRCTCQVQVDYLYRNIPQCSTCTLLHPSESYANEQSMCNVDNKGVTCDKYLSYFDILDFAFQIARGMEHLEKMKCIHRDLAARNVLIAEGFLLKVGDFGLARNLGGTDYYRKITSGKVPARWMAIESLEERKHTSKSDVWSYGVLLWEIFTYGRLPYGRETFASSIERLCSYISDGHRLQKPKFCSNQIYSLLMMCWHSNPEERPSFSQLVTFFKVLLDTTQMYFSTSIQDTTFQSEIKQRESAALSKVFHFGVN